MPLLRVGIDASGLLSRKPATGIERYVRCLALELAALCEECDLRLYLYFSQPVSVKANLRDRLPRALSPSDRIRWRSAPISRGWLRVGMGMAMQFDRLDVFHFPSPRIAGYCPVPGVVTFHDVVALSLEAKYTSKEAYYLREAIDAGRRATVVIAVSENTKTEVETRLKRPHVVCIPESVDRSQFHPAQASEVDQIRATYGLDRYVLCVGTLQTRKNHLGLIQAFEQIQDRIPQSLVIIGRDGSGAEAVRSYLDAHPNPRVRCLGFIEDKMLPAFYTGADAFALPSLWEGFGLPLLEAMACGTPVLTSKVSALVEVVGEAAVLVNPRDTEDIADGLFTLLTDEKRREQLIARGLERVKAFSWETAARKTIAVYRQAAATRNHTAVRKG